jgi:photosystem II stability/assembly factor-like uncharacterized protein
MSPKDMIAAGMLAVFLLAPISLHADPDVLERPALKSDRAAAAVLLAMTRAEQRLVAVGERGIVLLSDDHGASWRQAAVPVSVSLTGVHFATPLKGWAVGHSGVVLHSADGGETWRKQLDGVQAAARMLQVALAATGADARARLLEAERLVADGPDKPFFDVYFADENRGLVVGAFGLLFTTNDGGASWEPSRKRVDSRGRHLHAISAAGATVYIAGEQGALYRSTDAGETFASVRTPYDGSLFGVLQTPRRVLVYGLRGNAYWSSDHGKTWHRSQTGSGASLVAGTVRADGSMVLLDQAGATLRSRDQGNRFEPLASARAFPYAGVVEAQDGSLVVCGLRGLVRIAPDAGGR